MADGMLPAMNKTTLYFPDTTQRRLRDFARRTGRRQAEVVREAVERYLDAVPAPLPSSIGSGEDDSLRGRDTADWLRENWRPR